MKKKVLGDTLNEIKRARAMEQYAVILEWLYTNDGGYENKLQWREALDEMLREVLLGEKPEEGIEFCTTNVGCTCIPKNCTHRLT